MREPGRAPQFDRLIGNLERAKKLWAEGSREASERLLVLVASISYAEAKERGPNDPVPEAIAVEQTANKED